MCNVAVKSLPLKLRLGFLTISEAKTYEIDLAWELLLHVQEGIDSRDEEIGVQIRRSAERAALGASEGPKAKCHRMPLEGSRCLD